ncbi:CxC2 domain-containing protein [Mycena venus]|uniref:CxC2 domain-containing protein n=1 Tax=Mycena venus TaxID=2733690 RepID=A0A8H6Z8U4_9AGAR|nr:CxC2 domain-containing protein [Mycena venus]
MFMTNTKRVKGLQTTGIGGVTCSQHNMWQGNGIGDLQVGERYCNMNFLLLSVLFRLQLLCIVISYDIACQYNTTFWECMKRLFVKLKQSMVSWKVPNFHLHAHKLNCHGPFSFHFMWGTGMTHKQNWAFSNGVVASTRLMGPGAQQATLEDVFGFHNYDRVLGFLPKCLAVSIKEGMKHKIAFEAFTKGMEEARPEDVVEWKVHVLLWEATPHPKTSESPFELVDEVSMLHDIQLRTAAEEYVCTEDVVEIKCDHTPRSFIMMGLELKQIQRKLEIDVRALKDPSPAQKLVFTKHRTSLLKRIHKFRQIQGKQVFDGNSEQQPEATPLFMPSELASNELRAMTCMTELAAIEAWMREGGAGGGKPWPLYQNDDQLGMMTKGQGILCHINIKIHTAKLHYRYAWVAFLALQGHGPWEERLQILDDNDVQVLNKRTLMEEEKKQNEHWAELGGAIIEGRYSAKMGAAKDTDDAKLHDALQLEWSKAYA